MCAFLQTSACSRRRSRCLLSTTRTAPSVSTTSVTGCGATPWPRTQSSTALRATSRRLSTATSSSRQTPPRRRPTCTRGSQFTSPSRSRCTCARATSSWPRCGAACPSMLFGTSGVLSSRRPLRFTTAMARRPPSGCEQ
eukprot:Amastigsp_a344039_55.p3 type:complete len:139 gc:universal Amastigsp_a344039_55:430-846(+)